MDASSSSKVFKAVPKSFPPDRELDEPWDYHNQAEMKRLDPADKTRDVLIFVANDREMQAALRFVQITYQTYVVTDSKTKEPAFVGTMPCVMKRDHANNRVPLTVLLVQLAEVGSRDQGSLSVLAMLENIIHAGVNVGMVLALGCCAGISEEEQKVYHVAVSHGVRGYERAKFAEGSVEDRGDVVYIARDLQKTMKRECARFSFGSDEDKLKAHFGIILCGDKVVDNAAKKAELLKQINATKDFEVSNERVKLVAIEMEGTGTAYAVWQLPRPMPWMVIKGISDWGKNKNDPIKTDGLSKKFEQVKATFAAFAFAASMLHSLAENEMLQPQTLQGTSLKESNANLRNRTHVLEVPSPSDPQELHKEYELCIKCLRAHDARVEAEARKKEIVGKVDNCAEVLNLIRKAEEANEALAAARARIAHELNLPDIKLDELCTADAEAKGQLLKHWQVSEKNNSKWKARKLQVCVGSGADRRLKRTLTYTYKNYTTDTLTTAGVDFSKLDLKNFMKIVEDYVEVVEETQKEPKKRAREWAVGTAGAPASKRPKQ